jgi:hypothetical protein
VECGPDAPRLPLRAAPPLAAQDPEPRAVFSAALQQSEELFAAAEVAGPAAKPLPLFYALSQAGRAIAAAQCSCSAAPARDCMRATALSLG